YRRSGPYRDRRQGIPVRRRQAALRSSARIHRYGRRFRSGLPLLLDAVRVQSEPAVRRGQSGERGLRHRARLKAFQPVGTPRTIYISGAGIAGLTLALGLAKFGLQVVVLERNSAISEFGAGLQISP